MKKMSMIILYVSDQERSKQFYESALQRSATLHVPGMTEFILNGNFKLGLMPENGISKILTPITPHPKEGSGIPRCELYVIVDSPQEFLLRAVNAGAKLVSTAEPRDWGDTVGYCSDPDGHIIAFAK
jgi:predicted enzyme related to lactoylglutathione lyase